MLPLIVPLLVAGLVAAMIWFSSRRRLHSELTFPRVEWAAAHHVIVLGLMLASDVVLWLPEKVFPPWDGYSFFTLSSALSVLFLILAVLLTPLTLIAGAVVTFARNRWFRDIVLALVWVVTARFVWEFVTQQM